MNDEPLIDTRHPETLTLRDRFAMAALNGYLASWPNGPRVEQIPLVAEKCFQFADAMLAERAK